MLRAAKDGAPPAYDAGDEAAYHAAPAPSEPAPPPGRRAARAAAAEYDSIKPPPAATLDLRRLGSVLTRLGEHELLRTLRALRRPDTFRAEFLAEPGAVQQGPRRRTVMAPHLPTAPENLTNALETSSSFWVDHDAELNERFQAWLAQ